MTLVRQHVLPEVMRVLGDAAAPVAEGPHPRILITADALRAAGLAVLV